MRQLDERPHRQIQIQILRESTQNLHDSVKTGCFICSTYWKRVERAAHRTGQDTLDFECQLECTMAPMPETACWSGYELLLKFQRRITPIPPKS